MKSLRALFLVAAIAAFAAGFALPATGVLADDNPGSSLAAPMPAPPGLANADQVIDAEAFAEVAEITERITPYLYVGDDGLVRLRPVTADELGVTEKFLADFRLALENSNTAIAAGDIVVNDDLTVTAREDAFSPGPIIGEPPVATDGAGFDAPAGGAPDAGATDGAVPEWGAWRYPSGAIFYNSYPDWVYYRRAYYGLCNTMAAYLGYPWMSRPLVYFYGYNQLYFNRYAFNPGGVYWYMPYSYCNSGLGYKPGYFWGRRSVFGYGCGCYQYQWAWIGIWCRY